MLSALMFVGTTLLGWLPSTIKTSQRWMNLVAIMGAGLLVGAALIVIVPEGMVVLTMALRDIPEIEESETLSLHAKIEGFSPKLPVYAGASLMVGFTIMLLLD